MSLDALSELAVCQNTFEAGALPRTPLGELNLGEEELNLGEERMQEKAKRWQGKW